MKGAKNGGSPIRTAKGAKADETPPTRRERVKRHATRVVGATRTAATRTAGAASSTGAAVASNTPGTDAVGGVFKALSLAGLVGLAVFNPTAVTGLLQNGVKTIRTIISGA